MPTSVQISDLEAMLDVLDLDQDGDDTFTGKHPAKTWQRTFGGQLLGQAVIAAGRTVPDCRTRRPLHALHAQFVRTGRIAPITYQVTRLRDERSLANRVITAYQDDQVVAMFFASFQTSRVGLEHSEPMSVVPGPEELAVITDSFAGREDQLAMFIESLFPMDIRYCDDPPWELQRQGRRPTLCQAWMRADGVLPEDPLVHHAALAWCSDMTPLDPIITRHGLAWGNDRIVAATLNHAIWFHQPPRLDNWVLYTTESPTAAHSRALVTGHFHARNGTQIATVQQENVVLARLSKTGS